MNNFNVGEIAIFHCPDDRRHGQDVEIYDMSLGKEMDEKGLKMVESKPFPDKVYYYIQFSNSELQFATTEKHLRKKYPPNDKGWEDIKRVTGWNAQNPVIRKKKYTF